MAKYASLRRVRLTRDGYIMKGDRFAGHYRGTPDNLYRLEYGDHPMDWREFREPNRANAVIAARQWLSEFHPGMDVRS